MPPPVTAPVTPEAAPAPAPVVPKAEQKTPEQLAADLIKVIPDAPFGEPENDLVGEDAPSAEPVAAAEGAVEPAPVEEPQQSRTSAADLAIIAAQRRAVSQQRRAQKAAPAAQPQSRDTLMAEVLQQLTERLAPKPAAPPPSEFEVSLDSLARQTGMPPREIYRLLTDQLAGKAGPRKVPVAPLSAEAQGLADLRAQLNEERAARTKLEETISQAGREWEDQQRQAEMRQTHMQLSGQLGNFVDQNKTKYPFAAAADRAEVSEALAIAASRLTSPLTADQLVARLEARLKADYTRLKAADTGTTPVVAKPNPQRTATPQQPLPTPQHVAPQATKKPFVIPPELHGVRGISSASEAARVKAAMDLLKVTEDEA